MRRRRPNSVLYFIGDFLMVIAMALAVGFLGIVLLEFLVGCGAMYTDSEGVRHMGECIWLNVDKGE